MTNALASRRSLVVLALALAGALALALTFTGAPAPRSANAASHREAPLISLDPSADITDFFMFRSYEPGKDDKVVLIMNVFPGSEPSSGPNYFNFDPNVRYQFHLDTVGSGRADDVQIEFRFRNEIRGAVNELGLPLSYVGGVPPATGAVIPPITALDGPGSEGFGLRQKYSVSVFTRGIFGRTEQAKSADSLIAVPSNVGPRTMPNYAGLAGQGVYDLGDGVKVFAGQRQDPFYIDLGAVFDTLNLRRMPPVLSPLEDATDNVNSFGVDTLAGFNVQTIAIELPASMITADAKGAEQTAFPKIGGYAATYRPSPSIRGRGSGSSRSVQVQRLANPLVNELIIGTKDKDEWNRLEPNDEARFLDYYQNPRLALALELVFGVPAAKTDRNDLVSLLLGGPPNDSHLSELLRLDLSTDPKPLASQKRLSVLAGDNAGWPNGRRPRDDVTDIAIRVVGGPNYVNALAGDGVNVDDADLMTQFPFLALPADGRDFVSGNKQTPHLAPPDPTGP
jgi:uncharacterized protein DUF4331